MVYILTVVRARGQSILGNIEFSSLPLVDYTQFVQIQNMFAGDNCISSFSDASVGRKRGWFRQSHVVS